MHLTIKIINKKYFEEFQITINSLSLENNLYGRIFFRIEKIFVFKKDAKYLQKKYVIHKINLK